MEFNNSWIVAIGFCVWLFIAPRPGTKGYRELFLAYMIALLMSLLASSELIFTKPTAFFFTVGGTIAFIWIVFRSMVVVKIKRQ